MVSLHPDYEILRTIGSGGMGDVYQARRVADGQFVAIKVLREDLIKETEAVARFRREARAAAALKSPHAARIFTVGEATTRQPFIVMEYLDGLDLMNEIDTRGALPAPEAVAYVAQACHAMIEAHSLGIVHRDLKPPNLFLAREGNRRVVKVLDFGISKVSQLVDGHVTSTQMSFGSPLYMSPEQIRSTKLVDGRSDVWSLGVILYEALTGEPPFVGETPGALAVVISVEPHLPPSQKRPDLPRGLDAVIDGALQKDPKRRFASVQDFLRALEPYLPRDASGRPTTIVEPPPLPASYQAARPPGKYYTPHLPPIAEAGPSAVALAGTAPPTGANEAPLPPKTLVIPPRITLGPATTDPPIVSAGQRKERVGLILAAILIPLGALAFGFAIWLYAKRATPRPAAIPSAVTSETTTAAATERAASTSEPVLTPGALATATASAAARLEASPQAASQVPSAVRSSGKHRPRGSKPPRPIGGTGPTRVIPATP